MPRSCLFVINYLRHLHNTLTGTNYACVPILIMCPISGSLTQLIIGLANLRFSATSPIHYRRVTLYHLTVSD